MSWLHVMIVKSYNIFLIEFVIFFINDKNALIHVPVDTA